MADFSAITSRLFTGAALTTEDDVQQVVAAGVTAIIDCRLEYDDRSLVDGYNQAEIGPTHPGVKSLRYLYNGVADDGLHKAPSWFGRSITFGLGVLATRHHRLLCHCAAGVQRGPSTAYALLRALGFEPAYALDLIHVKRPVTVGGIAYAADADVAVRGLGYA